MAERYSDEFITQRMREAANEQATHRPDNRKPVIGLDEAQYVFTRKGMADMAKSSASAILGLPADVTQAMAPLAEGLAGFYEDVGYNPLTGTKPRPVDINNPLPPNEQPFTTEWFQKRFGVNRPDSAAATIGTFLDPEVLGKKILFAGALGGSRAAANLLASGNSTIAAARQEAIRLMEKGANPQTVWEKTNWILDPADGHWKFQIPVENSKVNWTYLERAFDQLDLETVKLGDFLDNKLLYDSYPQLKDIDVSWDMLSLENPFNKGSADIKKNLINVFAFNKEEFHDTLVHEIEHFIQDLENFPAGGTPTRVTGSAERGANQSYTALAENRWQRSLFKALLDQPQEVFGDTGRATDFLIDHIAAARQISREEAANSIGSAENFVLATLAQDARTFSRTGRMAATERAVINLGLKGSILEQRAAFYDGVAQRAKALGLDPEEEANLLKHNFYEEYKLLAGEANARLASYDLKLSQGTQADRQWLRMVNPITRRARMLREEGLDQENLITMQTSDARAVQYADWYEAQLRKKAAYLDLQEAVQEKLAAEARAEARGRMAEEALGEVTETSNPYGNPGGFLQSPPRGAVRTQTSNRYVTQDETTDESLDASEKYPLHVLNREPSLRAEFARHVQQEEERVKRLKEKLANLKPQ